ncbi:MAG: hypothetical protein ABIQ44_02255, partial [Chloroflexia bacterium]
MELADIEAAIAGRHPRFRAKQMYEALYAQRRLDMEQVTSLPAAIRNEFSTGALKTGSRYDSYDGTVR